MKYFVVVEPVYTYMYAIFLSFAELTLILLGERMLPGQQIAGRCVSWRWTAGSRGILGNEERTRR